MEVTKTSKSFKNKLSKLVFRTPKPAVSKSEPTASPPSIEKAAHDDGSSPSAPVKVKTKGEKGGKFIHFLKERVPRLVKKFSKQPSPSPQTPPPAYASPNEVEQCQDVSTEKQTGEHDDDIMIPLCAAFSSTASDSDVEKELNLLKLPAVVVALEERARRNEVVEVSTSVLGHLTKEMDYVEELQSSINGAIVALSPVLVETDDVFPEGESATVIEYAAEDGEGDFVDTLSMIDIDRSSVNKEDDIVVEGDICDEGFSTSSNGLSYEVFSTEGDSITDDGISSVSNGPFTSANITEENDFLNDAEILEEILPSLTVGLAGGEPEVRVEPVEEAVDVSFSEGFDGPIVEINDSGVGWMVEGPGEQPGSCQGGDLPEEVDTEGSFDAAFRELLNNKSITFPELVAELSRFRKNDESVDGEELAREVVKGKHRRRILIDQTVELYDMPSMPQKSPIETSVSSGSSLGSPSPSFSSSSSFSSPFPATRFASKIPVRAGRRSIDSVSSFPSSASSTSPRHQLGPRQVSSPRVPCTSSCSSHGCGRDHSSRGSRHSRLSSSSSRGSYDIPTREEYLAARRAGWRL